ncbi:hypothetical protein [Exiguobacterium alkaliphilum]|uniref:Uncharacterized protein n=1 Tax=Exiguobacterium alkaliphilum TaxID=1428684 RepID=A0ABT2KZK5_9BACL|nr:hypothetical protein [Exiguobacterium alkaliphilum]MCT4796352.1 hypothetical protein [Exiguobacterium alkaliphilum]
MKTYWQIAAGNGEVNLEELFLKLNVALIGPARLGEYFENTTSCLTDTSLKSLHLKFK